MDLSIVNSVYFKTIKLVRFFYLYLAYNKQDFTLGFCTFVDFVICYIYDFFHFF
jgi:hypothetical protein